MKVLIIVGSSLRYCPYANYYINIFREMNISYDVVFPDRAGLNDKYSFPTIVYQWNKKNNKYKELLNYRKFVLNLIKKDSYDCVVTLTTVIAILFYSALIKLGIKYIVDIRDFTHEDFKPYYWVEKQAIKGSACCLVSSPGFRKFLPKGEYIDVFNAPNDLTVLSDGFIKNEGAYPIRISYIGTIAYPEQCERLMKLVENDDRFIFDLYGNDLNGDRISRFIKNNKYTRSIYHGEYKPDEKPDIIKKSDILFNAYGNDSELLLYALSNKLTDSVMYSKPVLNSPGTSMHDVLGEISFAIDLKSINSLNELYIWYMSLSNSVVENKANEILDRIIYTNKKAKDTIISSIYK